MAWDEAGFEALKEYVRAELNDAVVEVARLSFPDHFEDRACFENRLALYPRGCFVLEEGDGAARGYLIAYPWRADSAPQASQGENLVEQSVPLSWLRVAL